MRYVNFLLYKQTFKQTNIQTNKHTYNSYKILYDCFRACVHSRVSPISASVNDLYETSVPIAFRSICRALLISFSRALALSRSVRNYCSREIAAKNRVYSTKRSLKDLCDKLLLIEILHDELEFCHNQVYEKKNRNRILQANLFLVPKDYGVLRMAEFPGRFAGKFGRGKMCSILKTDLI